MKKGFTLVELLAVIIILGVILLIVLPSVVNTINKANKDAFASSAKKLIDVAKVYVMDNNLELPDPDKYTHISINSLKFENQSAYGTTGGVLIINVGTASEAEYDYYAYLSNSDFVINGSNKDAMKDSVKNKGAAVPYTAITLPSSTDILVNETLGVTGHVENVTVAGSGYNTYTHQ